jgi:putative redox protein
MKTSTTAAWKENMAFDVELQGHTIKIDAAEKFGGGNYGPRPKALLLSGLAGCTGMDVVSILRKMQMPWDSFNLEVEGDTTEEHPVVYNKIHIKYIFTGGELDVEKITKAVNLSQDKYCGVSAMLGKTAEVTWEIVTGGAA